jgi:ribosome maturation factor RimP
MSRYLQHHQSSFSDRDTGGGLRGPPFCALEIDQPRHTGLEARIAAAITPTLEGLGYELVRVAVLGRDVPTVQIMADRADGALIAVEDCETISHAVSAVLDVDDPIPGAWHLEVSSAGIDRPLTRIKDWNRYAGHTVKAETDMPVYGRKRFLGTVLGADAEHARLRLDDGTEVSLPHERLRRARLVLTDALIAASAAQSPASETAPTQTN